MPDEVLYADSKCEAKLYRKLLKINGFEASYRKAQGWSGYNVVGFKKRGDKF